LTTPDPHGDLPEAAGRRMAEGSFTSGLTVPDFAASLHLGLEPVAFVQGFNVMQWGWYRNAGPMGAGTLFGQPVGTPYGAAAGWSENWQCPHGYGILSAEHRAYGINFEETWVEQAWTRGITGALDRMVEEAATAGAHGVVGVVDSTSSLADMGVLEFRTQGTAVRVVGAPAPAGAPWTTYLAGERLTKLIEAGYAPMSVALTMASVQVYANCVTQYLARSGGMYGGTGWTTTEVQQLANAQMAVRNLARRSIRATVGPDSLHAASLSATTSEIGEGDAQLQCLIRGNRVRRFKGFDPVPPPVPTVRLS